MLALLISEWTLNGGPLTVDSPEYVAWLAYAATDGVV